MFFCFIIILDCLGVALSNFCPFMITWWRFHRSIPMQIDLLVVELQWKQISDMFGNTVSGKTFYFGKSFRTSYLSHDDELGLNLFRKLWLRWPRFLLIFFINFIFHRRAKNVADFFAVFVLKRLNFEQSSYGIMIRI